MGKKKIVTVSQETKEEKVKKQKGPKKIKVAGLKGGEKIKVVEAEPIKIEKKEEKEEKKKKVKKEPKKRGKKYQAAKAKIDSQKLYSLKEAVKLAKQTSITKFPASLEAHLTVKKTGSLGEVDLPYFKGKEKKVAIADDEVIEKIKKGKIDFDILLADPKIMPKLIPLARVLGPKGLMPNPKQGTLTDNPQEAKKKFAQNTLKIKTEKKAPVVHLVLGKTDQEDKELIANAKAVIKAIGSQKILKMVLTSTMGPGVKVKI